MGEKAALRSRNNPRAKNESRNERGATLYPRMTVRLAKWRHGNLNYSIRVANKGHLSHA
jgi:hypothetical protein